MTKPRPKKQHFVPQLHLRYFAGTNPAGMVWTYDAETGRVSPSLPKETAVETNFYSVENGKGEHLDVIEDWLANVESKAAPIYEKLLRGEIPQGQERADFSAFLSSMYSRTHALRRIYGEIRGTSMQMAMNVISATPERFEKEISKYEAATSKKIPPDTRSGMREWVRNKENYIIQVGQEHTLSALTLSDKLLPIFFDMGWAVLGSKQQHLITSDNPVVHVNPPKTHHPIYGDGGFMNKKALVTFPLSPEHCLMMGWGEDITGGIIRLSSQQARTYNRKRAYFSERYIYADRQDEGVKRLAEKYKDNGMKMQIGSPDQFAKVKMVRRIKKD